MDGQRPQCLFPPDPRARPVRPQRITTIGARLTECRPVLIGIEALMGVSGFRDVDQPREAIMARNTGSFTAFSSSAVSTVMRSSSCSQPM